MFRAIRGDIVFPHVKIMCKTTHWTSGMIKLGKVDLKVGK